MLRCARLTIWPQFARNQIGNQRKKDWPVTRDTGQPNSCFDLWLDEDQIATGNIIVNQRARDVNIRQLDSNVSAATITIGIN